MIADRRPGGRTVPSRRFIGGRMNQASVKQVALESFRLGQRIAEMRHNDTSDEYQRGRRDGYFTGWEDGAESVRVEYERDLNNPAEPPQPLDLGGPAPVEASALLDEADDLMAIADAVAEESPMWPFNVPDWQFLLDNGVDPGGDR